MIFKDYYKILGLDTNKVNIDEIKISAYDSATYQNNQLENVDVNGSDDTTTNNTNNVTEHTHGNIGVTRTQQMITEELSLRLMSVYGLIAKQFADEMLLSIW